MSKAERISDKVRAAEGNMVRDRIKAKKSVNTRFTQTHVAHLIGREQTIFPQWLSGATQIPDISFIALSSILDFDPTDTRPYLREVQSQLNNSHPPSEPANRITEPSAPGSKTESAPQIPVLTMAEATEYLDSKQLPPEYNTIDAVQSGIENIAFAMIEETDQYEPAIHKGAKYTILPIMVMSAKSRDKITLAARLGNDIIIGRLKNLRQDKVAILQPDGEKEQLTNGPKDIIGIVLAITNP